MAHTPRTAPEYLAGLIQRRQLFSHVGAGLAGIALAGLLQEDRARGESAPRAGTAIHVPPKAKAVIQLFQHGGPSHMDTLDPKPRLNAMDGQKMPDSFKDLVKVSRHGNLMGTPYKFSPSGNCGVEYSEIVSHTASCADDIAVVRSMFTEHNNHEQALWHMHTGRIVSGRPTIGAWVHYALGSENQNLPAYIVLRNDRALPIDGTRNWSNGFLPPKYQGVHFRHTGTPVLYLNPSTPIDDTSMARRRGLWQALNALHRQEHPQMDQQLEARIASYEMAGHMQHSASEALDLTQESAETLALYGVNETPTDSYARRCLIARRLIERGVRYVQIYVEGQIWDTHNDNAAATKKCCDQTDKPAAGLLKDLRRRGLLDSTLVIWGGEFGRTPVSQDNQGRDHHKQGFSVWLAGGGIRGGQAYGATDELGYYAVDKPVMVADLHATILHLLGLDHKQVTFHVNGRDERLTDVYDAKVIQPLLS